MKYKSFLPLSALLAIGLISMLVHLDYMPPGDEILNSINNSLNKGFYGVIFLIILLEAIVYVGFYFPGQFFAVVLVVGSKPSFADIVYLTLAMVFAATLGSFINYKLGQASNKDTKDSHTKPTSLKQLLLAMIHINSLAFFMFSQGAKHKNIKVVYLAGLLNLPYYLLLIAGTAVLSEQIMAMAENTVFLLSAISVWLVVAFVLDVKQYRETTA